MQALKAPPRQASRPSVFLRRKPSPKSSAGDWAWLHPLLRVREHESRMHNVEYLCGGCRCGRMNRAEPEYGIRNYSKRAFSRIEWSTFTPLLTDQPRIFAFVSSARRSLGVHPARSVAQTERSTADVKLQIGTGKRAAGLWPD